MGDKIGKNLSENATGKYSQKLLDHAEQSARDVRKTGKATGDLICNKIARELKNTR